MSREQIEAVAELAAAFAVPDGPNGWSESQSLETPLFPL